MIRSQSFFSDLMAISFGEEDKLVDILGDPNLQDPILPQVSPGTKLPWTWTSKIGGIQWEKECKHLRETKVMDSSVFSMIF